MKNPSNIAVAINELFRSERIFSVACTGSNECNSRSKSGAHAKPHIPNKESKHEQCGAQLSHFDTRSNAAAVKKASATEAMHA